MHEVPRRQWANRTAALARVEALNGGPAAFAVGSAELPLLWILRHLVQPIAVAGGLFFCALVYAQPFTSHYVALAIVTALMSTRFMSAPQIAGVRSGEGVLAARRLAFEWFTLFTLLLMLGFVTKTTSLYSRKVLLTWLVVAPFATIAVQWLMGRMVRGLAGSAVLSRTHLVVGANGTGQALACALQQDRSLGTFVGFVDDDRQGAECLGGIDDVLDCVRRYGIDVVHIALPPGELGRAQQIVDQLRDTTASIYLAPEFPLAGFMRPRAVSLGGLTLISICESPLFGVNSVAKRGFDIVVAALLCVALAPLMLALGALVKLDSPGPVLFRQRRYGLDGREIVVYKFRTMSVCEDGSLVTQASRDDPRVTRFGRFLRRSSLDELPQLANVLQGRMSLVGPRPHAVSHNEEYRRLIGGYMLRHKLRPGITGWAQVNGERGETDTVEKMRRRVELDLEYLRSWSLWLDVRILLLTGVIVWRQQPY